MHTTQLSADTVGGVLRPIGGFRMMSSMQLCAAWWAYRVARRIRYADFRVYLGLHEIDERRRTAERVQRRNGTRVPRYRIDPHQVLNELARLCGRIDAATVRGALDRLTAANLISHGPAGVFLPLEPANESDHPALASMLEALCHRKFLPVPRPVLRHIAAGCPMSRATAMLGYVARCVFYRSGRGCTATGSCSTVFIARLFGVSQRTVKRARRELITTLNWLRPLDADHWHVQAHGGRAAVNLAWRDGSSEERRAVVTAGSVRLSPRPPQNRSRLSPPVANSTLPLGSKYQKPALTDGDGARQRAIPRPNIRAVRCSDLRDPGRLAALLEQAQRLGLVGNSDSDRLQFFAAAARAVRVGRTNPAGFFVAVVRKALWSHIACIDERQAHSLLSHMECRSPDSPGRNRGSITVAPKSVRFLVPRVLQELRLARPSGWPSSHLVRGVALENACATGAQGTVGRAASPSMRNVRKNRVGQMRLSDRES